MSHTPGPWTLVSKHEAPHDKHLRIMATDPQGAANDDLDRAEIFVLCDDVNTDTAWANACLVSAAPDLLAALERIVLINGSTGGHKAMVAEFKHIARTAIAKARGDQE